MFNIYMGLPPAGLCYIMLLWNLPPLDLFQSLAMSAERNSSVINVTFLLNQIVVLGLTLVESTRTCRSLRSTKKMLKSLKIFVVLSLRSP